MDTAYDEDISENPFFVDLQAQHGALLQQCCARGWLLCVPRAASLHTRAFCLQDFLAHVLVRSEELPETHFLTLTERPVRVRNRAIQQDAAGLLQEIHILFDETFYTQHGDKYTVLCLEAPLEGSCGGRGAGAASPSPCPALLSLRDCMHFLWTESCGKDVLEDMDLALQEYRQRSPRASLSQLRDSVGALYSGCLQRALKSRRLRERAQACRSTMDNVKLCVETYMHHAIYSEVFEAVGTCTAFEDSSLNKIIRNLSDIQLRDLDVSNDFNQCIPEAKRNLSQIQTARSVMGKVVCVKNTVSAIRKCKKEGEELSVEQRLVSSDELLPVLIFLVIKSGVPNWLSHLTYMKHLRFSVSAALQTDEASFYISTLEAVLEHIRSGLLAGSSLPEAQCPYQEDFVNEHFEMIEPRHRKSSTTESGSTFDLGAELGTLEHLFEQVRLSNYDRVKEILEENGRLHNNIREKSEKAEECFDLRKALSIEEVLNEDNVEEPLELCHPLCTCSKCTRLLSHSLMKTSPTVLSCDTHGFTILHIACIYGKPLIVDLLVELGAQVNATDCSGSAPLHYAAAKGHQNAVLLLLHAGSDINSRNMDGNTALHLASNNGHDCCVKALVYFSEHCKAEINVNAVNSSGDSPLHLASKWGYVGIARLLLEHGADPHLHNHKGKTCLHYAHSNLMLSLLLNSSPNLNTYVQINLVKAHTDSLHFGNLQSKMELVGSTENELPEETSMVKVKPDGNVEPGSMDGIRQVERLFRAIRFGDTQLACFYLNLNESSKRSNPASEIVLCHPLCTCAKCGNTNINQPNQENQFNLNTCDSQGDTALHIAAKHGRIQICQILVDNSANVEIRNKNGLTPLLIAVQENKVSIVKLLLEAGADVRVRDCLGNSALHLVCSTGSVQVCRLLLDSGGEQGANMAGRTPLDVATDNMYLMIISLLQGNSIF